MNGGVFLCICIFLRKKNEREINSIYGILTDRKGFGLEKVEIDRVF